MNRNVINCYYLQLIFLIAIAALTAGHRECMAQTPRDSGPNHFSTANALPQPVIHDPNFGSPFYNTPFTMGEVLRSQGQLPPITTTQNYNRASCLAVPGNSGAPFVNSSQPFINSGPINRNGWLTYNLGTLGIVSPGWAGYPFYYPYNYNGSNGWGYPGIYHSWGYSGYYNPYALYNKGLPYGWVPFWQQPVNRLVPNYGLIFSMAEIVNRGNARFGPTRPVRQLRNANRNPNNNGGILLPGAGPAKNPAQQGMNAVPPIAARTPAQGPADPLKVDLGEKNDITQREPVGQEPHQVLVVARPAVEHARIPQKRNPKLALTELSGDQHPRSKISEQLQTGDRLARNGLYEEARNCYEVIARRQPEAPEPWLRIAQIEVLTGHELAAIEAWQKFQELSGQSETHLTKQLRWSDIADATTRAEAVEKLNSWTEKKPAQTITAIRATINLPPLVR